MGKAIDPEGATKASAGSSAGATLRSAKINVGEGSERLVRSAAGQLHAFVLSDVSVPETIQNKYQASAKALQTSGLPPTLLFDHLFGDQLQRLGRKNPQIKKLTDQYFAARSAQLGCEANWEAVSTSYRKHLADNLAQQSQQYTGSRLDAANKIGSALTSKRFPKQSVLVAMVASHRLLKQDDGHTETRDLIYNQDFVQRHQKQAAITNVIPDSALVFVDQKDMDFLFVANNQPTPDAQFLPDLNVVILSSSTKEDVHQAAQTGSYHHVLVHDFIHGQQAGNVENGAPEDIRYLNHMLVEGATEKSARKKAQTVSTVMPAKDLHVMPVAALDGISRFLAVSGKNPELFEQQLAACGHEQRIPLAMTALFGSHNPELSRIFARDMHGIHMRKLDAEQFTQAVQDLCGRHAHRSPMLI